MLQATASALTVERLKLLANDAEQTHAHIEAVLSSLEGSEEQAQWASEALENCGVPPRSSVHCLAALTRHRSELVAFWACKLLARLGHAASVSEEQLVVALAQRPENSVREEAARALGELGSLSEAARTALATAAAHGSPRLKRLAAASLGG